VTAGADPQLGAPGADRRGGEQLGIGLSAAASVERSRSLTMTVAPGAPGRTSSVCTSAPRAAAMARAPAVVGAGRRRSEIRGAGHSNQQDQGEGDHDDEEEAGAAAAEEASLPGSTAPGWRAQRILKKRKKLVPARTANPTMARSIHSAKPEPPEWGRGTMAWSALVAGMLA